MLVTQETTTRYRRTTSQGVPEAKLGYTPGVTPEYLAIPLSETVMTRYPDYRMAYWKDRTARGGQGEGRRRGDPGFRREPAPAAALLAAGAEARRGHRPGIPHGMQGRGARFAGQPAAQHDRLPPSASGPGGRSGRDAEIAGRQAQGRGIRHRGRHGGRQTQTVGPRPGTGRSRGDIHGQRGRRIGLLGVGRGARGVSRLRRDGARGREHRTPPDRPALPGQIDPKSAIPN